MWKLRFDIIGIKTAFSLLNALRQGDDNLLRAVLKCFEAQGLETISVADLCPDLVMPLGVMTKKKPSSMAVIDYGKNLLKNLAVHDIGQSVALCDNVVLAIEALEGTDAMILRSTDIPEKKKEKLICSYFDKGNESGANTQSRFASIWCPNN